MPFRSWPRRIAGVRTVLPPRRPVLAAESLERREVPARFIAAGTDAGPIATVRIYTDTDGNGTYETLASAFKPFGTATTGVRVAMGDFDGDGNDELVTASGVGYGRVTIWDLNSDGTVGAKLETFQPWVGFTGGLFVAAGDLNHDGRDELAVSRGSGGSAVSIYADTNFDGKLGDNKTDAFNAWPGFQGGVRLAFGNTDNTGGDELIVARGPGGPATVAVYTDSNGNQKVSDEAKLETFTAFAGGYTGGITVAAGPIAGANNDGAEVIVARDVGKGIVRVFSDANTNGRVGDDPLFASFNVYNNFQGGVRVASGDTDASGVYHEVVVGPGPGGGTLGIWDNPGSNNTYSATQTFPAFSPAYKGGFFVAFGQVTSGSFSAPNTPTPLPDVTTTTSTVNVPTGAGKIKGLTIGLGILHTYDADLDVTLTHVTTGTQLTLFTGVAGSGDGFSITLQDGATDIGTATGTDGQMLFGTFSPEGGALLSTFNGQDASGDWVLSVTDDAAGDTGTLNSWTLNFTF